VNAAAVNTAPPIWAGLIGQPEVTENLVRAVADADLITRGEPGNAMTHAWLITGPPGSGRSTAATFFAAALVCPENGCGVCKACRTAPMGGHSDVEVIVPEGIVYSIEDTRELVRRSSMSPVEAPWRVIVIEDADRLGERAVNVLLKSLEEPTPHTVWVLCAPSTEDVLPTIRSRTRHVGLRTPSTKDVAGLLSANYSVDPVIAGFAARAAQGHIGRARALARDEGVRTRRQTILRIPLNLRDVPSCFISAQELLESATEDADSITEPLEVVEAEQLNASFGVDEGIRLKGQLRRSHEAAKKELAKRQKSRRTRTVRDQVDRALIDLMGLYRDVFIVQMDSGVDLINEEMLPQVQRIAAASTAEETAMRMQAITHARSSVLAGVAPIAALEALMVELKDPRLRAA
jgi:DNA polymerase-3 subunit delta'